MHEQQAGHQGTSLEAGNLTRDEARRRARAIAVESCHVDLDLRYATDPIVETFRSVSTLRFTARPGDATHVDLIAPIVDRVSLNGVGLDPEAVFDGYRIQLPALERHNELQVEAHCAYSRTGEGMHRFVDPTDGRTYLYTQYEPADARRVFACVEQPDVKASFAFTVRAPQGWVVRSNNAGTRVDDGGAGDGARWEFPPTPPISTYITTVLAGPYHVVEDEWRRQLSDGTELVVPLAVLCRASLAAHLDAKEIFAITRAGLDFFHDTFDVPYPFGRYDQAFVPEYNLGAMENPGLVTFTEDYVFRSTVTAAEHESRASTILHEMAHMWFGDLVTMTWWDDLWLKESFADYMGTLATAEATRFHEAWTTFAVQRKAWAYRQDQLPTTHPVVADITDLEAAKLNFDGITYAKGASVLKQLVAFVGQQAFVEGARTYFARYAYGNTTLADFLTVLEAASGRSLSRWSERWLQTAGPSTLELEIEDDGAGTVQRAVVHQSATDPASGRSVPRPHRLAVGCYDVVDGALRRTRRFELDVDGEQTELTALLGQRRPDLALINDDDLTYALTRLDRSSRELAARHVNDVPDSLPRALLWFALWHDVREARWPATELITAVARAGAHETHLGLLTTLHAQVRTALPHYVPAHARDQARTELSAAAWEAATNEAADQNRVVAWARLAITTTDARRPSAAARLRSVLDGTTLVDLAADVDMRWRVWISLAAAGQTTCDDLDAELAREDTAATRRAHHTALAARPTAEAKAAAWDAVAEHDEHPNATVSAIIQGFARPEQRHLTEAFTDTYFDKLRTWWATRSIEIARRLVVGLYPGAQDAETDEPADHPVVRATDRWLTANSDAPGALCRLVVEQRDDLTRSLRVQRCDPTLWG
ncbi:MAG TPA: aminopeptidase N [Jiangellaceae bacterium]|nr:aminopeptidase N [Jiangellaceae bacterium]